MYREQSCFWAAKQASIFWSLKKSCIAKTLSQIKLRLEVGRISTGCKHIFGGCEIEVCKGAITVPMEARQKRACKSKTSRTWRQMPTENAFSNKLLQFQCPAGTLVYLENAVLPQATLVVLPAHRKTASSKVTELIEARKMIGELRNLNAHIV